jgi:Tol biopolymer transport system component
LLVSGPVAQEKLGIWLISIVGTSLKKLHDDARDASLSPDGSQILFADVPNSSVWIMNADGSQARPLIKAEGDTRYFAPTWFANAKRFIYLRSGGNDSHYSLESRNLQGGDPVVLLTDNRINDVALDQPGRIVYSRTEPPPNQYDSNLWEIFYDVDSGKPHGAPRQLTQWTGFSFISMSLTSDGKRLVFLNDRLQSAAYIGELANGGDEMKAPERLTLNENLNWPGGWSSDGKTLFFYSNRDSGFGIYKQGILDRTAQPIATGPDDKWAPQLSPDGNWVIYMQWAKMPDGTLTSGKLMRVPVASGGSDVIADLQGVPHVNEFVGSTTNDFPSFRCPRVSADCVLAERRDKQLVFSSFDPVKGRKAELITLPLKPVRTGWDLSPDATRLAISEFSYTQGDITIVPLNGAATQKITLPQSPELLTVAWAADGKSLFAASFSSRGTSIVHLDLAGHSKVLFKANWRILTLEPSPDGKYLAFGPVISNSNAWTMGSFPAK